MPAGKAADTQAPHETGNLQRARSCSFKAAVQCVVALQRLQGGLNPSVDYTERSAARQPTTRWIRKTNSGKESQNSADGASSSSDSAPHWNSQLKGSFGSRGNRSDLLFQPLPPPEVEVQSEGPAPDGQPRTAVHISAQA